MPFFFFFLMWISSNPNLLERNMQLLKINYVFSETKLLQNMLQINILGMHKEKENKQKSLKKSTEELLT